MRPMQECDVREVVRIERGAYPFPWSPGIFRDCLRVGYCCWVLEHRSILRGYGIMSAGARESHILNLCVHERFQGRGMGRLILDHLLEVARGHRALTVMLEVRPSNMQALHLYRAVGFNEVGTRRGYYPAEGRREDALIMAMELQSDTPGGARRDSRDATRR